MRWVTRVGLLVILLHVTTGQLSFNIPPSITPFSVPKTLQKDAPVGSLLATLSFIDVDGPNPVTVFIADENTRRLAKLGPVPGIQSSVQVLLNTSLETEPAPSTQELYVVASDGLARSTSTIVLSITNPPGTDVTDGSQIQSSFLILGRALCNQLTSQSPASSTMSRFRLFCIFFQTFENVLSQLPIDPADPSNQAPSFPLPQVTFRVMENTGPGRILGQLTATDTDGPQSLTFNVANAETNDVIRLGTPRQTGNGAVVDLYTRMSLDRERTPVRTLHVTASDGQATATVIVRIDVVDVNDNSPRFARDTYTFSVPSNAPPGTYIGRVKATDADEGRNGNVSQTMQARGFFDIRVFYMDPTSGQLQVRGSLASMAGRRLDIYVLARDGGGRNSSVVVQVYVNRTNPVNGCDSFPCQNEATCMPVGSGNYTCYCRPGYYGRHCSYKDNTAGPCGSGPCRNGATCEPFGLSNFTCYCAPGYYGRYCSVRINTTRGCESNPCLNGATCEPLGTVGNYMCYCRAGYYGPRCSYKNSTNVCVDNLCRNGATCRPRGSFGDYECFCPPGYYGRYCSYRNTSSNGCDSYPCQNDATCMSFGSGNYTCYCRPGYYGRHCSYSNNTAGACASGPCRNGATCEPFGFSNFTCYCAPGYLGRYCSFRMNTSGCDNNPCKNGATCEALGALGNYRCFCRAGYYGRNCTFRNTTSNPCQSYPCYNGATCRNLTDGLFQCYCAPGYVGRLCFDRIGTKRVTIQPSVARTFVVQPRKINLTCTGEGSFVYWFKDNTGVADLGFSVGANVAYYNGLMTMVKNLTKERTSSADQGNYRCASSDRQQERYIRVEILNVATRNSTFYGNETSLTLTCNMTYANYAPAPPHTLHWERNGRMLISNSFGKYSFFGTGNKTLQVRYLNNYDIGRYYCVYTLREFQQVIRVPVSLNAARTGCSSNPCHNNSYCSETNNGSYTCICQPGFVGEFCNISTDGCASSPCKNGAYCSNRGNGSYVCYCQAGFTGVNCEIANTSGCFSNPCQNGSYCSDTGNGTYTCHCQSGFGGRFCNISLNACSSNPCLHDGYCALGSNGTFTCYCISGYAGRYCEIDTSVNGCGSYPCQNGGSCSQFSDGSYTCTCPAGFTGTLCTNRTDVMCGSVICQNGGSCYNGFCMCPLGFRGSGCEIDVDECQSNPCQNGGTCIDRVANYTCICERDFSGRRCERPNTNETEECGVTFTCGNGGSCYANQCVCFAPGIFGDQCEIELGFNINGPLYVAENVGRGVQIGVLGMGPVANPTQSLTISVNDTRLVSVGSVYTISNGSAYANLMLNTNLDREMRSFYRLQFTVFNGQTQLASKDVSVSVLDVNDNRPVFVERAITMSLSRTAPLGRILSVRATDADSGQNGNVTYFFDGVVSLPNFVLDRNTGVVSLNSSLQSVSSFITNIVLNIGAMDHGIPPLQAQTSARINIRLLPGASPCDSNPCSNGGTCVSLGTSFSCMCLSSFTGRLCEDSVSSNQPPRFLSSNISTSVAENADIGMTIATLTASDVDDRATHLTFSLLDSSVNVYIQSQFEGQLFGQRAMAHLVIYSQFDREVTPAFIYGIQVRDSQGGTDVRYVDLTITDINDNPPQFTQSTYQGIISSNTNVGEIVASVYATDADIGSNAMITFSIQSLPSGKFSVDSNTGRIMLAAPLTEPAGTVFSFQVLARNAGFPGSPASVAQVNITVRDPSDPVNNAPKFNYVSESITVDIGEPVGSRVTRLWATDTDGPGEMTFSVDPVPYKSFIRLGTPTPSSSGDGQLVPVYLNQSLVTTTYSRLEFTVRVSDGLTSGTTKVIIIIRRNPNAPVFEQSYYSGGSASSLAAGAFLLQVHATDADNDYIIYNMTFPDQTYSSFFAITSGSGVIETSTSLASIPPNTLIVMNVSASDNRLPPKIAYAKVEWNITDSENKAPRFYYTEISQSVDTGREVGSVITRVPAEDLDGPGEITFSIVPSSYSQYIRLSSPTVSGTRQSVQIILNQSLLNVTVQQMTFTISASDGISSATSQFTMPITYNLNTPVFQREPYSGESAPTLSTGTFIYQVRATDADRDRIRYGLTIQDPAISSLFTIDSSTGGITTTGPLTSIPDNMLIIMNVSASDGREPPRVAYTTVEWNITNAANNAPTFLYSGISTTVDSGKAVGSELTTFHAEDTDGPGEFIFRVVPSAYNDYIRLDTPTGTGNKRTVHAILNQSLLNTTVPEMDFVVEVSDGISSSTIDFQLKIRHNRYDPVFIGAPYRGGSATTLTTGSSVLQVQATDADQGDRVIYSLSIEDPAFSSLFTIDSSRGIISSTGSLAGITPNTVIVMTVTASDGRDPPRTATARVEWNITVTTTSMTFSPSGYTTSVVEHSPRDTVLTQLTLVNVPIGAVVDFVDATSTVSTQVSKVTGRTWLVDVLLNTNLDFEVQTTVIVPIIASPRGLSSATCSVTINVLDVNDNSPVFSVSLYTASIPADLPENSLVLYVDATDLDGGNNGRVTYSLQQASNVFAMNETTGVITVIGPIPTDWVNTMQDLYVVATDGGIPPRSATVNVKIAISSTPDDGNNTAPTFTRTSMFFSLPENQPNQTSVGTLTATDVDGGGQIEFRLLNVGNMFALRDAGVAGMRRSVELLTNTVLDREQTSSIQLLVVASDSGQTESTATVTVQVTDQNDNSPVFAVEAYSVTVPLITQVGSVILYTQASDADSGNNGQLTYSKQGTELSSAFRVDSRSGQVVLTMPLDRSLADTEVQFTITATDNGIPPLSTTVPVTLNFTLDAAINRPPVFLGLISSLTMRENSQIGSNVTVLMVSDPDGPDPLSLYLPDLESRNTVDFGFQAGNDSYRLLQITLNTFLNREVNEAKVFRVVADDGVLTTTATVTINIEDTNDNAPRFVRTQYSSTISVDTQIGERVVTVAASDWDLGDNGRLTYRIASSTSPGVFAIDAATGAITVMGGLTAGTDTVLTVTAQDGGVSPLSASIRVTITVMAGTVIPPTNQAPRFSQSQITISIAENTASNTILGNVRIFDSDGPQNVVVNTRALTNQADANVISVMQVVGSAASGFTAYIQLNTVLDREAGSPTRELLLVASDGMAESTATVTIEVGDMNDNRPVFSQTSYTSIFDSSQPEGTFVLTVSATDADTGLFGEITYTLQSTQAFGSDFFTIDASSGVVTSRAAAGQTGTVDLIVRATDGGRLSAEVPLTITLVGPQ